MLSKVDNLQAVLEGWFATSPSGVLLLGKGGEVQAYNERFLEFWNLPPDVARSASARDLDLYMSTQTSNAAQFLATTQRFHDTSPAEGAGELIRLTNGRVLSRSTRPIRSTGGSPDGRIWDYQDVTALAQARSQIRLARYTLDHAQTPVFWLDVDGRFVAANNAACSSLGYSQEELLSLRIESIAPDRSADRWRQLWDDTKARGQFTFEGQQQRKSGEIFPVEVSVHYFSFETTEMVCGFVRDLTDEQQLAAERQRLDASVQQAQKFEGLALLAGGVAHDFNNLLVGMLGNLSLVMNELSEESPIRPQLEQILSAGEHATELTQQLLAYAGRADLELTRVDLSQLVLDTKCLLHAALDPDCELKTELAEDLPATEVDATQIRQVLINLVTNGSESLLGSSGTVTVTTRVEQVDSDVIGAAQLASNTQPGTFVAIEVRDTGAGMGAETIRRVLDPFFTTKLSAHGLGLAAVRGVVHQHHGLLQIDSITGKGSAFTVLLPTSELGVSNRPATIPNSEWRGSGVVLLVDDNPSVLRVGRRMLELLGFAVVACESGSEAIAEFETDSDRFSLAIVDLTMPQMNGREVVRKLRETRSNLPTLLSSGYSEIDVVSEAGTQERVAYLPKPYTIEELRLRIEAVERSAKTTDGDDWVS